MTLFPADSHTWTSPAACRPLADDWRAFMQMRWNLLVSGPRHEADAFVLALTPYLQSPIRRAPCGLLQRLPPEGGTLILDDVESVDDLEQQRLLWWLEEHSRAGTQVITIAPAGFYTHVQAGAFLSVLYYRLNPINVEIGTAPV